MMHKGKGLVVRILLLVYLMRKRKKKRKKNSLLMMTHLIFQNCLIICQIIALPFVLNPLCYLLVFQGLARVVWFGSWLLRPVLNVCKIKMGLLQETIA